MYQHLVVLDGGDGDFAASTLQALVNQPNLALLLLFGGDTKASDLAAFVDWRCGQFQGGRIKPRGVWIRDPELKPVEAVLKALDACPSSVSTQRLMMLGNGDQPVGEPVPDSKLQGNFNTVMAIDSLLWLGLGS